MLPLQIMNIKNTLNSFTGKVIHGMEIGRTIGYPTANILSHNIEANLRGVYVVSIILPSFSSVYYGIMNIGTRPSLGLHTISIEVHILNFNDDIYNHTITITPLRKLRDEQKFNTLEELKQQISLDKLQALQYIASLT